MSLLKKGIEEKYEKSNLLFELQTGSCEIYVIETNPESVMFNNFVLIWGDYVANAWEEEFDFLSQATARMAQVIYVSEQDEEGLTVMFKKHGEEFNTAWREFQAQTTEYA